MRITYVEKTGRKKVRVTMDDGESFVVSERDWESFGGKAGEDLEDELILKLYREYMLPRAKFRALNLLKVRDRSRQELAQRLKMDGYPESIIKDTMAYVDSYHYLDDARFARNYVDYRGSRKSRRELEYELKMKGIDLRSAAEADEYLELPDDRETIQSILAKRWGSDMEPDPKEKERMMRYLGRRGFRGGDILYVYKKLGI
ncbi:regulatory protein RecX [Frisingicoccus sp.]|uniref:regulatory protein RecX n=1 Tax=Frisingicoccus sp. TaxID=1918627 RepID=UPI002E7981C7|nr:regulatory protein RecX [Frisingicoccus sp.]MEE0751295.1 regulatory protein RecX [Frisingicoccus sp.]